MKRVLPDISFTVAVFLLVLCMSAQAATPDNEVKALREIAEQLKKKDWNFSVGPCTNETSWFTPKLDSRPLYSNSLICNYSNPDGVCHVVELFLGGQDLAGVLPPALVKLPYLKTM
nr:probable LRR receptor-like serine/threonine-protein kinase At1g07650 [Quercus suber]